MAPAGTEKWWRTSCWLEPQANLPALWTTGRSCGEQKLWDSAFWVAAGGWVGKVGIRALPLLLVLERTELAKCSPSAARSKWVNEEILTFKRLHGEDRIFSFIVDGEPNVADDPARAAE